VMDMASRATVIVEMRPPPLKTRSLARALAETRH